MLQFKNTLSVMFSAIFCLGFVTIATCQMSVVPPAVTNAFKAEFPNVKKAGWEKEGAHYEVEFMDNNMEHEVIYDKNGKKIAEAIEIKTGDIPANVMSTIKSTFPNQYKIEEAEKITRDNMTFYEVEIKSGNKEVELLLDSTGKVLGSESEEEEGDDDDN